MRATLIGGAVVLAAGLASQVKVSALAWPASVLRGERCPLSDAAPDPARLEQHRRESLEPLRGRGRALTRPALAFELGQTTLEEARGWLEQHGGCCRSSKQRSALVCASVAVPGELPIDSVHLALDPDDRVVAVDLFRSAGSGREALAHLERTEDELSRRLGSATARTGAADPAYVEARALRRIGADFRYGTYLARISAMNFGDRAIRVRETYDSLSAPTP